jgi:methylated-DNA-[protein]-cysteine S-methyltransferase
MIMEYSLLIDKMPGTTFQKKVWKEIAKIPRGSVKTYGEIAKAIGSPGATQAVGTACGKNPLPIIIPCHRVVAANSLGGYAYGTELKEVLLASEMS